MKSSTLDLYIYTLLFNNLRRLVCIVSLILYPPRAYVGI